MLTPKVLLDTGATASIISKTFVTKLKIKSNKTTSWKTTNGHFDTFSRAKLDFAIPEMDDNWITTHNTHP